jgi:pimeloyl-ACP methyl ester carboxylesterase
MRADPGLDTPGRSRDRPSMMLIVDGTGPKKKGDYDQEMGGGFCRRLEHQCQGVYWQGPATLGLETPELAREVVAMVRQWRRIRRPDSPLFLAGHSRGGAAVLIAARQLKDEDIKVDAMFLFDAVRRVLNSTTDVEVVPSNVKRCYHAMRDPSLQFHFSGRLARARDELAACMGLPRGRRPAVMEDLIDFAINGAPDGPCARIIEKVKRLTADDVKMKVAMRSMTLSGPEGLTPDFGNCATRAENPDALECERFRGSHGAIGGAPIVDDRAPQELRHLDHAAMQAVWQWMSGHLLRHGAMRAELLSTPPDHPVPPGRGRSYA